MKTTFLLISLLLSYQFSCVSANKPKVHKVTFGIHDTFTVNELPDSFIQTLKNTNIQFEKNTQSPVIGYIQKSDSMILHLDLRKEKFRIVKTFYPVDKDAKYFAVVAIYPKPAIDISDIQTTECNGKNVEIHFNMKGAKKWAEITKNNIGKIVAFTIDNQIYTMPKIMAEIKTGEALINGLGNETIAKSISETLNSSIVN